MRRSSNTYNISRSIPKRLSLSRERDVVSCVRVISRENPWRFLACKSNLKTFVGKKLIEVSSWFKRRVIDFSSESEEPGQVSSPTLFHVPDSSNPSGCAPRINSTLRLWNEQLCGSPRLSFYSEIGDGHNSSPLYFRSFLCRTKVSPFLFLSISARGDSEISEKTKMNSAAWETSDQCRGWEGRANRPQLGLFASYRVGVKINVNFAVELISPAPINPTNSLCLLPFSPLFLSFCSSLYIAFLFRFSLSFPLSMSGFPYRRSITDIFSTLPHPEASSRVSVKLENFRGEKKHRVSAAFGKKLPSFRASFPGSFPAGIRVLFVAITYAK